MEVKLTFDIWEQRKGSKHFRISDHITLTREELEEAALKVYFENHAQDDDVMYKAELDKTETS